MSHTTTLGADLAGIPLDWLGYGSGWAIVCLFVIALYRGLSNGNIATRREVDQIEHDRDEWRAESRLKDAQIAEKDRQLEHMGEVGRLVKDIMRALGRLPHDEVDR